MFYFCGSIRGGQQDVDLYHQLINHIKTFGPCFTEHVGDPLLVQKEITQTDVEIWEQDMSWLRSSKAVIAECTVTSLGVGYELGIAESLQLPVIFSFY
jgi:hypothetical protein